MKKQRKAKPRARKTRSRTGSKPAKAPSVLAQTVESPVPFLEVAVRERVTEASMMRVFEQVCAEVLTHNQRRVFVDMRESEIVLTISDKADMAKLIGKLFAGKIDRLACLLRPHDLDDDRSRRRHPLADDQSAAGAVARLAITPARPAGGADSQRRSWRP